MQVQPGRSTASQLSRRAAVRLLVAGSAMAVLTACGPAAPPAAPVATVGPPAPSGTATAPPAAVAATPTVQSIAQPRTGGTLRLAIPADITSLDGHISSTSLSVTTGNLFDRLVAYDLKLQPQPMLAESWDVSSDYTQVKLALRKGVQWHTGREFTSDDVKYNLLRGRDPKVATGTYVNQSKWFTTVDTPDKYTIVLKSDASRPAMFDYFNVLNMIDPVTAEGPDAKTKSVGTGPFTFGEWVQGDHLTLARNKNYWLNGRPYLDQMVINVVRDVVAMSTRLEAGNLDAINAPTLDDFVRLKADPRYVALIPPGQNSAIAVGATTLFPPTDNKQVRQALNYALDRKRYAEGPLHGIVPPLSLPWDKNSPAYEAAKENFYPFDLDKAKSLVDEAGVSGAEMDFLPSPNNPEFTLISQILQADLARIGIKLNIVTMDQAAWLDQVNNRKYHGMWASTMSVPVGDPITAFSNGRGTDPNSNNEGYKNDTYAQLIAAGAAEPDAAKRKQIYSQLNDILLDDAFVMVLAPYPPRLVTTSAVHDIVTPNSQPTNFYFTDAWLAP
jgi:peptide/nickel transport system substrate-binding protein